MNPVMLEIMPLAAKNYCCSQILMLLALRAQGVENWELVRATSGVCHGMGASGLTCGILTGGCLVLGLYVGRGREEEMPHERADLFVTEFVDWFRDRVVPDFGDITCQAVMGDGKPDMTRCGGLLAEAWTQILTILTEAGIDPSLPRE
ncbi:DVU_1555 family C-GCAxxG-C-C protein [Solidesulfovibrio sp.]|uniref:DVU_1555 family C-GCAxxG-C-C protein n=1 Tax=Solidesulfovibrio sp. TaxID=2910990 RepID=UPI00262BADF3|nr:DV_1555 family C-GCAxxG-C-C protein [Solidesulfovibrio sp.]